MCGQLSEWVLEVASLSKRETRGNVKGWITNPLQGGEENRKLTSSYTNQGGSLGCSPAKFKHISQRRKRNQ